MTAVSSLAIALVAIGGVVVGLITRPFSRMTDEIKAISEKLDGLDTKMTSLENSQQITVGVLKSIAPPPIKEAMENIIPMDRIGSA